MKGRHSEKALMATVIRLEGALAALDDLVCACGDPGPRRHPGPPVFDPVERPSTLPPHSGTDQDMDEDLLRDIDRMLDDILGRSRSDRILQ